MHRVKNLNFWAYLPELHSIFDVLFLLADVHPLLVVLHPLLGIERVIYRWKAAVNMQLSRVDHFFILATILKVFHLKFIQRSSWTSCCFHVELLWRIFVCNFLIHSSMSHKWYLFCTNLSHNKFFNFLRPSYTRELPSVGTRPLGYLLNRVSPRNFFGYSCSMWCKYNLQTVFSN